MKISEAMERGIAQTKPLISAFRDRHGDELHACAVECVVIGAEILHSKDRLCFFPSLGSTEYGAKLFALFGVESSVARDLDMAIQHLNDARIPREHIAEALRLIGL